MYECGWYNRRMRTVESPVNITNCTISMGGEEQQVLSILQTVAEGLRDIVGLLKAHPIGGNIGILVNPPHDESYDD